MNLIKQNEVYDWYCFLSDITSNFVMAVSVFKRQLKYLFKIPNALKNENINSNDLLPS